MSHQHVWLKRLLRTGPHWCVSTWKVPQPKTKDLGLGIFNVYEWMSRCTWRIGALNSRLSCKRLGHHRWPGQILQKSTGHGGHNPFSLTHKGNSQMWCIDVLVGPHRSQFCIISVDEVLSFRTACNSPTRLWDVRTVASPCARVTTAHNLCIQSSVRLKSKKFRKWSKFHETKMLCWISWKFMEPDA